MGERDEEEPPTEEGAVDPLQVLHPVIVCREAQYVDCERVKLRLGEPWSEFEIKSIKVRDIPEERALKLTGNNEEEYEVLERYRDSDIGDGVTKLGLYLESEGATSIV